MPRQGSVSASAPQGAGAWDATGHGARARHAANGVPVPRPIVRTTASPPQAGLTDSPERPLDPDTCALTVFNHQALRFRRPAYARHKFNLIRTVGAAQSARREQEGVAIRELRSLHDEPRLKSGGVQNLSYPTLPGGVRFVNKIVTRSRVGIVEHRRRAALRPVSRPPEARLLSPSAAAVMSDHEC